MFFNIFKKKVYKVSKEEFQVLISNILQSRTDYGINMYKKENLVTTENENAFFLKYALYHIFIIEMQLCIKYDEKIVFNLVLPFYESLQKYLENKDIIFIVRDELIAIYKDEPFVDAFHNPIYTLSKTFAKSVFNIEYDAITTQLVFNDFLSSYSESYIIEDYKIKDFK